MIAESLAVDLDKDKVLRLKGYVLKCIQYQQKSLGDPYSMLLRTLLEMVVARTLNIERLLEPFENIEPEFYPALQELEQILTKERSSANLCHHLPSFSNLNKLEAVLDNLMAETVMTRLRSGESIIVSGRFNHPPGERRIILNVSCNYLNGVRDNLQLSCLVHDETKFCVPVQVDRDPQDINTVTIQLILNDATVTLSTAVSFKVDKSLQ